MTDLLMENIECFHLLLRVLLVGLGLCEEFDIFLTGFTSEQGYDILRLARFFSFGKIEGAQRDIRVIEWFESMIGQTS